MKKREAPAETTAEQAVEWMQDTPQNNEKEGYVTMCGGIQPVCFPEKEEE